jgi:hypothetical protein
LKNINYSTYSNLIDALLETINKNENVSIYCDYELANELLQNVNLSDYEDSTVELDEDIDEYYFSKFKDVYCGVEKARCETGQHKGNLKYDEADYIILFAPIVESLDEVLEAVNADKELLLVNYEEYDLDEDLEDTDECDCCQECDECESQDFGEVIADRIITVMEILENPDTCEDCKFEVLMDLVLLGVDGALDGYIGRKED